MDVYKIYEGDDFDKIYEVLSTLRNKKFKMNNYYLLAPNFKFIRKDEIMILYWVEYTYQILV